MHWKMCIIHYIEDKEVHEILSNPVLAMKMRIHIYVCMYIYMNRYDYIKR